MGIPCTPLVHGLGAGEKVVSVKFSKLVVMVSTQGVSWLAPCGGAAAGGKIARYAATASAGVFFTCSLNRSIFK
ncbi:MAG: hypothetical protein BWX68_02113 [Verrucomicrobia bacterium ADurb.Bin063]|nr:MAG: hypothetical protein BWX68_02113 [Verrucomicrobia bacterium ADurb.Bin063]